MTDFKTISLGEIRPDPNQPRRFYDETAMQELTDSVREKGILQPILIRPNGHGYLIVCGERRFRAATAAQLKDIPAVIRDLSNDEALELQIIENLQRKDVHPMEEAVAFKSLLDQREMTVHEISRRVGKNEFYVRQRLHLNQLIPSWQKAFHSGCITLTAALKVCALAEKDQKALYDGSLDNEDVKSGRKIELSEWKLREFSGDLSRAAFSLEDPTLDKKMGPCTTCRFNSAVASLFPEDVKKPQCGNTSCYKHKTDVQFDRNRSVAEEEPGVLFISRSYSVDKKVSEQFQKAGHSVLTRYDFSDSIDPDDQPDWDDFDADDYDSEKERKEDYDRQVKIYEKRVADQQKKIAAGKLQKAFVVDGNDRGQFVYIELDKKGDQKTARKAVESGEPTTEDVDTEIARIKDREKRTSELDDYKVWSNIFPLFDPRKHAENRDGEFTDPESEAIVCSIYNKLDYQARDLFKKTFKLKEARNSNSYNNAIQPGKTGAATIRQMIRFFFLSVLPEKDQSRGCTSDAKVCLKLATEYFPTELGKAQTDQSDIASRRKVKVAKRIADLQAKKKELAADIKKAAPVKKKNSADIKTSSAPTPRKVKAN